ncbi:coproporphyrinogen-III oxidase family protein [Sphaerisporangium krabiense]|uniref:Heme chaperone HemW n=1 Tax=Sphaerisporangium krabiense TaxID=763782 RepID=A0A7W8Z7X1_9ACTN|nr:radical SAM protein [Sphaerisporangium krabiense]MBB5628723.1 oxygen-independent coproporphyrinogen-3 oxidase [Sphaerisporangium krabiense]
MSEARPLLVYVHIPFCSSKCHFCDWVTEIPTAELLLRPADSPRRAYIAALCQEIRERGAELAGRGYRPEIMYWGGGTASILAEHEIEQIGAALHEVFDLSSGMVEATIECSPESLTAAKLAAFRQVGFRRWSSGVQSFDDRRLRRLGRSHDAGEARRAVELAAEAGFDDRSIDLICGLPGEDLDEVTASVRAALELPVTHVALYPYRPAHGTVLRRQVTRGTTAMLRSEQKAAYARGAAMLVEAGFPEYAMSHFGHRRCHSDMAYFQLRMDWAGFGSGATSLIAGEYLAHRRGFLAAYNRDPLRFDEHYPAASPAIASRLLYQSLTTFEGASRALWEERTGVPLEEVLALGPCRHLLGFLERVAEVRRDAEGVRLRRDQVSDAFIDLQFAGIAAAGGDERRAAALLG